MNFEARARRAYERGEPMRALFLLVEGFKRQQGSREALLWLLELYASHNRAVGLEEDIVHILSLEEDASQHLTRLIVQLEQHQHQHLIDALLAKSLAVGLMPAPVEDVFETPPRKHEHDGVFMEVEVLDILDDEDEALETFDEPFDETSWSTGRQAKITFDAPREAIDPIDSDATSEPTADEPLDALPPQRHSPKPKPPKRSNKKAWLVVAAITVAGLVTWAWVDRRAGVDVLDRQMERLDVLNPQPFERALKQSSARWGLSSSEVESRRQFATALMALETEHPALKVRPQGDHPWSLAAGVLHDIHAGALERAIAQATTLSHQWPNQLPSLWASARLAQARGQHKKALDLYEQLHEKHPQFLFGMMARLRMAAERGDHMQWDVAQRQILALDENHPYLTINTQTLPTAQSYLQTHASYKAAVPKPPAALDSFLQARQHYFQAYDAWRRQDGSSAKKFIAMARKESPLWFESSLLEVVITATHGSVTDAARLALDLGKREDLSPEARLKLMGVMPYILCEANACSYALALLFDPGGDASAHLWLKKADKADRLFYEQNRPVSFALQPSQWQPHTEVLATALMTRAHVLLESGYGQMAIETIKAMAQAQVINAPARLLRLEATMRMGQRHHYQDGLRALGDGAYRAIGQAALSLLENNHQQALTDLQKQPAGDVLSTPFGVRVYVRALLANEKYKEALSMMKAHPWMPSYQWSRQGLVLRVLAKANDANAEKLLKQLEARRASHISQKVDLAAVLMWRGQIAKAQALASQVIARQPNHPEANRIMGVTYRHMRQYSKSHRYMLKASAMGDEASVSSQQVASMYMELGRFAEARKLYYKAFLANRQDVVSLGGMARAFMKHDAERGRHEFARFYQGFVNKSKFRAQAGETSKWLGVLHGSREGKPESLSYLARALKELGPRADVLIEYGRYHHARGEHQKARAHFVSALQADSTSANAHLGLAKVALSLKQMKSARGHLHKFLELQPFGPQARWAKRTIEHTKSL